MQAPTRYSCSQTWVRRPPISKSVKKTSVARAFPKVGKKMLFLFDYGDEWLFRVEFTARGQKEPKRRYPKVLASVGKAPEQYPDPDDFEE